MGTKVIIIFKTRQGDLLTRTFLGHDKKAVKQDVIAQFKNDTRFIVIDDLIVNKDAIDYISVEYRDID